MAEVIGLVASVITITAVLTKSVKAVKEYYRAFEEVEALEAQVEHFSILLEGIHRQEGVYNSAAVATILSTVNSTLEKLNQLVQVELVKNMHGTSRARKRAWARNKSKVYKMQNELKELRASLTAAMGASSLSSAIRAETALNSMNHCLSNSEQTSLSLDRHLLSIQQIVAQTYDAVSAQGVAMNRLLQSNISDSNCYRNLTEHQSSWPSWHSREPQYPISRLCSDHSKEHVITDRNLINPGEDHEDGREHETPAPGPWSPFEVSQNAFPESYTTYQLLPTCSLIVLSSCELTSSAGCRTNYYSAFYLKSQRQWCRLNITIRIHESSVYWKATRVSKQRLQMKETSISELDTELPCSLRKQIQTNLLQHDGIIEDSHFRYQISEERTLQEQSKGDDSSFRQFENLPKNLCQNALTF
ncbi:hypothetical protein MMC29_007830 [Sticta canariensis]|nr:hypothetical protein [Sticta canariensis]